MTPTEFEFRNLTEAHDAGHMGKAFALDIDIALEPLYVPASASKAISSLLAIGLLFAGPVYLAVATMRKRCAATHLD